MSRCQKSAVTSCTVIAMIQPKHTGTRLLLPNEISRQVTRSDPKHGCQPCSDYPTWGQNYSMTIRSDCHIYVPVYCMPINVNLVEMQNEKGKIGNYSHNVAWFMSLNQWQAESAKQLLVDCRIRVYTNLNSCCGRKGRQCSVLSETYPRKAELVVYVNGSMRPLQRAARRLSAPRFCCGKLTRCLMPSIQSGRSR